MLADSEHLFLLYSQNNHHRLTLVMKPDDNYNKNCQEVERAKLEQKVYELTDEQKNSVYRTGITSLIHFNRLSAVFEQPTRA
jgi:Zn-dependent M16 (insulinase) family peptidase